MKTYISIFLGITLLSCGQSNSKRKGDTVKKIDNIEKPVYRNDSINEHFLKKAVYKTALKYNNLPTEDLKYMLNEVIPIHFRSNLNRFYSKEQLRQSIPIREVTWEYDSKKFITVWYHQIHKQFVPFDTYIYSKTAQF